MLILPLDVANQNGEYQATGGLPMESISNVLYISTVVLVLLVIPFTSFYYEGSDGRKR